MIQDPATTCEVIEELVNDSIDASMRLSQSDLPNRRACFVRKETLQGSRSAVKPPSSKIRPNDTIDSKDNAGI